MRAIKGLLILLLAVSMNGVMADDRGVDFVDLKDGDVVASPFKVKFAVTGMTVSPAGDTSINTGHHHLLINAEGIAAGQVVPADERHIHFGKGQTETLVTLPSGQYTLTLQFANGLHQSYGEMMRKSIHVTVK
ncbi:MAG: hypothetical protein RLZZ351_453 [Pseudomonadota bacterium]